MTRHRRLSQRAFILICVTTVAIGCIDEPERPLRPSQREARLAAGIGVSDATPAGERLFALLSSRVSTSAGFFFDSLR